MKKGRWRTVTRQRSWQEYRNIDLTMMAVMLAVCEFVIVRAATWWFPDQLYTVSVAAAVTSIVYMRWGVWGAIHAVEAGFIFCFFSGATGKQFVIYCAGNLLSVVSVFAVAPLPVLPAGCCCRPLC